MTQCYANVFLLDRPRLHYFFTASTPLEKKQKTWQAKLKTTAFIYTTMTSLPAIPAIRSGNSR
jgi:hypothetical protein